MFLQHFAKFPTCCNTQYSTAMYQNRRLCVVVVVNVAYITPFKLKINKNRSARNRRRSSNGAPAKLGQNANKHLHTRVCLCGFYVYVCMCYDNVCAGACISSCFATSIPLVSLPVPRAVAQRALCVRSNVRLLGATGWRLLCSWVLHSTLVWPVLRKCMLMLPTAMWKLYNYCVDIDFFGFAIFMCFLVRCWWGTVASNRKEKRKSNEKSKTPQAVRSYSAND